METEVANEQINNIDLATKQADMIVLGRASKILPGRWNTADGTESGDFPENNAVKAVYTTFYLEPQNVLFGESKLGEPIPCRLWGGTNIAPNMKTYYGPELDVEISEGETVLVFLELTDKYLGGYFEPKAYSLSAKIL